MSTKLTLYYSPGSPPSRSCMLLARYLELDIDFQFVDLAVREQHSEDFLKLNPLHKVPVLVDGDFVMSESRAILAYLVSAHKPESDLLPTDPKERALVDQRLYYDATVLFDQVFGLVKLAVFQKVKVIPQETKDAIWEVFKTLDEFLQQSEYFAGENLTIADFSIVASVSSLNQCGYDLTSFEHLNQWYEKLQTLPYFEENLAGAERFAGMLKNFTEGDLF